MVDVAEIVDLFTLFFDFNFDTQRIHHNRNPPEFLEKLDPAGLAIKINMSICDIKSNNRRHPPHPPKRIYARLVYIYGGRRAHTNNLHPKDYDTIILLIC